MQEYKNGSFGEILDGQDLLQRLMDNEEELLKTKKVHFGSLEELEDLKKKKGKNESPSFKEDSNNVEERLSVLEEKVEKIKGLKSKFIHIPSEEEIEKFVLGEGKK